MKTVCFINTHYFPTLGGLVRYTKSLANELQKKGVHTMMITLNVSGLSEYEIVDGMEIFRLPCINLMDGRFPIINPNRRCLQMLKKLKEQKIDLMIINARFYVLSLYMSMFAKKNKIHSIVIDHGSSHLTMSSFFMTKLGEYYEHISTMILKLFCKEFYGVSKASCQWLKHFGIEAKGILYNAVDIDFINSVLEKPVWDIRKKYNLTKDAFIVTYTGRLVIEKGILQLIEAVENLRKKYPQMYLFIAGDGPLRKQIEEKISEGIVLLGQVELEEIISLLKDSKILCLPSASEGFPTSVLEAVACKCFVAATKIGGATEIIPTAEYGVLLEENDVAHIQEAIEYALTNQELVQAATIKSYERMVQNFTWQKTGETVYQMIL